MVNCFEILKEENELRGYSLDTIAILTEESLPPEECEKLLAWLEVQYG
jgi:hypothetical protein